MCIERLREEEYEEKSEKFAMGFLIFFFGRTPPRNSLEFFCLNKKKSGEKRNEEEELIRCRSLFYIIIHAFLRMASTKITCIFRIRYLSFSLFSLLLFIAENIDCFRNSANFSNLSGIFYSKKSIFLHSRFYIRDRKRISIKILFLINYIFSASTKSLKASHGDYRTEFSCNSKKDIRKICLRTN